MKKYLSGLTIVALTMSIALLVGCGTNRDTSQDQQQNIQQDTQNQGDTAENTSPMTKEEYETYLTDRYNYYFNNANILGQYSMYNVFDDNFDYEGSYDEFVTGYNDLYKTDRSNLESLKKDLETNVRKGDAEVDKFNDEVMTALDKAILTSDEYGASFEEKTKDYGTLAKDEVIKGLRDIGRVPHDARVEFNKVVESAKETLGIK